MQTYNIQYTTCASSYEFGTRCVLCATKYMHLILDLLSRIKEPPSRIYNVS